MFRHELHGVRGLALSLVVLFHLFGNGRVSGGIDVFLAITGFLFTGSLLRRAVKGNGRISLVRHFGRLGQRLLPPILPVLVAIAAGAFFLLPESRWLQVARELRATILYYENWELIGSQLDYNAAGADTSPLQHFWSLSVQGQFYLVAPFVVMAVVMIALRLKASPRFALIGVLGAVFAGSMAYSVYLTTVDQPVAYFHSGARMWEFALGGLAALLLPYVRLSMRARVVLGWSGIAMIASCGLLFDGGNLFPGFLAAWPVMGMVLVLAGGMTTSPWGVDRLLVTKPFTFAADISYSLYLWHWPILIFVLAATGVERIGLGTATLILAASVVLAWLSKKYIEDPVQDWHFVREQRRKFAVALVSVALVAATTEAAATQFEERQDELLAQALVTSQSAPGAAALLSGASIDLSVHEAESVIPAKEVAVEDRPNIYAEGCVQTIRGDDGVPVCIGGSEHAERTVVVAGGSHEVHWWPALELLAQENDWRLVGVLKDACHLTTDRDGSDGLDFNESCRVWNRSAMQVVTDLQPDAVFMLGSSTRGGVEHVPNGKLGAFRVLEDAGIDVLAVRDSPWLEQDVSECFQNEGLDPKVCGQERTASLADQFPLLEERDVPDNVIPLDLVGAYCNEAICPAIVGNVIVMRDKHHVTATYSRSLAPFLGVKLKEGAPQLFPG